MVDVTPHDDRPAPSNDEEPTSFAAAPVTEPAPAGALPPIDFDRELCDLVADTAPALFAVCEEEGVGTDEANGWVVAWGLVWEGGRTCVMDAGDRGRVMVLGSPERALRWFGREQGLQTRLVWLNRTDGATFQAGTEAAEATACSATQASGVLGIGDIGHCPGSAVPRVPAGARLPGGMGDIR